MKILNDYKELQNDLHIKAFSMPKKPSRFQPLVSAHQCSARVALEISPPFDRYLFIEKNREYIEELKKLKDEFDKIKDRIEIIQGEANKVILT